MCVCKEYLMTHFNGKKGKVCVHTHKIVSENKTVEKKMNTHQIRVFKRKRLH